MPWRNGREFWVVTAMLAAILVAVMVLLAKAFGIL